MAEISLHREDLESILQFIAKYPDSDFVTINVDSSSGIGSIVSATIKTAMNGDFVKVTKDVVDETSW